jgi:hypothetical protein
MNLNAMSVDVKRAILELNSLLFITARLGRYFFARC